MDLIEMHRKPLAAGLPYEFSDGLRNAHRLTGGRPVGTDKAHSLSVAFILMPGFTLLPFAGFIETLRTASEKCSCGNPHEYGWTIMAPDRKPVTSSCGVSVEPWESFRRPADFDYVVIVGGCARASAPAPEAVLRYLRKVAAENVPLVGLCHGTFYLAQAGLLKGRRCCVHSLLADQFARAFPDVHVVSDHLFVIDRDRISCAGGAAAIDLAAHLVERHLGRTYALRALTMMLVDGTRPPDRAPASSAMEIEDRRVRKAVAVMQDFLGGQLSIEQIAEEAAISVRQLERRFRDTTGRSPATFLRGLRLNYARWLLMNTGQSLAQIAQSCGINDGPQFSRSFKREFGISPHAFRKARSAVVERFEPSRRARQPLPS